MDKNEYLNLVATNLRAVLAENIAGLDCSEKSAINFTKIAEEFLLKISQASAQVSKQMLEKEPVYSVGYLQANVQCEFCTNQTNTVVVDYENGKQVPACQEHFMDAIKKMRGT